MDPCFNLIYNTELWEGRLSQIMEAMLALLLTDETDWLLFRTFFLARCPMTSMTALWQGWDADFTGDGESGRQPVVCKEPAPLQREVQVDGGGG